MKLNLNIYLLRSTLKSAALFCLIGANGCSEQKKEENNVLPEVTSIEDGKPQDEVEFSTIVGMDCNDPKAVKQLSNLLRDDIRNQSEALLISEAKHQKSDVSTSELHEIIDNLYIDLLQPTLISNYYNPQNDVNECSVQLDLTLPKKVIDKASKTYEKLDEKKPNTLNFNDYIQQQGLSLDKNTFKKSNFRYDIRTSETEPTVEISEGTEILTFISRFIALSQSDKITDPFKAVETPKVVVASSVRRKASKPIISQNTKAAPTPAKNKKAKVETNDKKAKDVNKHNNEEDKGIKKGAEAEGVTKKGAEAEGVTKKGAEAEEVTKKDTKEDEATKNGGEAEEVTVKVTKENEANKNKVKSDDAKVSLIGSDK